MTITFTLNGTSRTVNTNPGETGRALLNRMGIASVRDSDDSGGFTGSDTIIYDGRTVNAGLMLAPQFDGHTVETVESLVSGGRGLSAVQSALVDAGLVQSGYNAPAAALVLTDLLRRSPDPDREEIDDALSSIFNRATGYRQFYDAVALARERLEVPDRRVSSIPEFGTNFRFIGKPMRKIDGAKLVRGERVFVEDMVTPGSAVLKVLRSPHAHAYIRRIETAAAEAIPGVFCILTYKNTPDVWFTSAGQTFPEPSPYDRRMFARKLYHVGDRVAAVAAENAETAEKALALIEVEYEPLKKILTIEDAEKAAEPLIRNGEEHFVVGAPDDLEQRNENSDPREGRIEYQFPIGADIRRNLAASVSGSIGDVDKGFTEADVVLERSYTTTQVQATPLEPHVVYTRLEGERLIIHASTQVPWHVRRIVARILGIRENRVRVIKERVGGGYGSKQEILIEDLCAYATWITGKPVYFRLSREEDMTTSVARFPMNIRVKLGARRDGLLTAMYMDLKANTGPYGNHCLTVPMNACSKSLPLFLCENIAFDVNVFYSNILPTGAYQGYGAPKANFALQTAMAELAAELGMDHLELIEKNRVYEGAMLEILRCLGEGREGTPARITSCGLGPAIEKGKALIAWGEPEAAACPDERTGKGMALVQQASGLPGLDLSSADVKLLSDGSVIVHSGGADIGTGFDTLCSKIAAEVLRIDPDTITVISGDTDNTPYDSGAFASSGTFFSGGAVMKAAEALKEQILAVAGGILGEETEALDIEYPGLIRGKTGTLELENVAAQTHGGTSSGTLVGQATFSCDEAAFPYGVHFAQVTVNTRTGAIRVDRYYALQDCGMPINPELAEGQIYGGVLKAIGHTLYEELILDADGACVNADLRAYGVPMIGDLPRDFQVHLIETRDPNGPFGGKSVSEISVNGAAPAIATAIHDAIGVWIRDWPITPEKILEALGTIPSTRNNRSEQ